MPPPPPDPYSVAAAVIRDANLVVAITGAGISVESGIPDFRSAGGVWSRFDPEQYATIEAFKADPDKVWGLWYEIGETVLEAKPHAAHEALEELEEAGWLQAVITQNIDNLHYAAGSSKVIEVHGNVYRLFCCDCYRRYQLADIKKVEGAPRCECGGCLRPDIVMFGELLPEKATLEAETLANTCDVMIIVGTSAKVYPAAGMPFTAKRNGAFIIECNVEETEFTREITDIFLPGLAGDTLPKLTALVRGQ